MSPHATGRRSVHRFVATGLPLALAAALVATGTAEASSSGGARVVRTAALGDIPLGRAVTGLPDQAGRDEAPYSYDARTALSYGPDGEVVRLDRRSDILGGAYDEDTASPSLKQLADPAAAGVPVLGKRLVVDLNTVPGVPMKIEGIARVNHRDSGIETTLVYVRLPQGL
ncbi:hypothetical protein AB0M11_30975 [Streptomyces sp. NPDC051987]|uniref:hypothetical protein n=1 Tax=Streptomyces sp. NPDC051987 TaxID=3155808 RepID=UPI0034277773